jgi:hypothetical protein
MLQRELAEADRYTGKEVVMPEDVVHELLVELFVHRSNSESSEFLRDMISVVWVDEMQLYFGVVVVEVMLDDYEPNF